jgi:hypothetical protein
MASHIFKPSQATRVTMLQPRVHQFHEKKPRKSRTTPKMHRTQKGTDRCFNKPKAEGKTVPAHLIR